MSSDHNSFLLDAKKIAVAALGQSPNPSYPLVSMEARNLVRKRMGQAEAKGMVAILPHRADQVEEALTRCALAMIEQWHIANGSGVWPPAE